MKINIKKGNNLKDVALCILSYCICNEKNEKCIETVANYQYSQEMNTLATAHTHPILFFSWRIRDIRSLKVMY